MVILEQTLNPELNEATDGRFFYETPLIEPGIQNPYAFSETFWLRHSDLLPDKPAVILQVGSLATGELVSVQDAEQKVLTLVFDSSHRERGEYHWQLIEANRNAGRSDYRFNLFGTESAAYVTAFDAQGWAKHPKPTDSLSLMRTIQKLASGTMVQAGAAELREARIKSEQNLSRFVVEGIAKYAPRVYDERLENEQKLIEKIGFSATTF